MEADEARDGAATVTPEQHIAALEAHLRECKDEGRYYEAECTLKKLNEFKESERQKRREALMQKHEAEAVAVTEAFEDEKGKFERAWARRFETFSARAEELMEDLRERQAAEFASYVRELQANQPRPRFSAKLLNLRRIEHTLAEAGEFEEAQAVQLRANLLEECELRQQDVRNEQLLVRREEQMGAKHRTEADVLLRRVDAGRRQLEAARDRDIEKLQQRFCNIRRELATRQRTEAQKLERYLHLATSTKHTEPRLKASSVVAEYIRGDASPPAGSSMDVFRRTSLKASPTPERAPPGAL